LWHTQGVCRLHANTTLLHTRLLSILGFGIHGGGWNQSPVISNCIVVQFAVAFICSHVPHRDLSPVLRSLTVQLQPGESYALHRLSPLFSASRKLRYHFQNINPDTNGAEGHRGNICQASKCPGHGPTGLLSDAINGGSRYYPLKDTMWRG
jgi:hypothetical protein